MKQFGILAALDSSHPKFGQALTVAEGTGEDALVLLDRGRRETEKLDARRAEMRERAAAA